MKTELELGGSGEATTVTKQRNPPYPEPWVLGQRCVALYCVGTGRGQGMMNPRCYDSTKASAGIQNLHLARLGRPLDWHGSKWN